MVKRVGMLVLVIVGLMWNIARADNPKVVVKFNGTTNFHGQKYILLQPVMPVQFGSWTTGPLLNTPHSIQVCEVYEDVVELTRDKDGKEVAVTATFLKCPDRNYRLDILLFPKDGK